MSLRVAIQMDPMETVNIHGDSTFALALEGQKRGYELYHYLPTTLSLNNGVVSAWGNRLTVQRVAGDHFRLGPDEKLMITHFADLMPPTLISADRRDITAFRQQHGDIIVKPLFGNGGAGVFHLRPDDENLNSLLEMFGQASREPVMVQRYLPAVRQGDKRIILVNGEAVGAINRVPAAGEARSNMHVGGRAEKTPLTDRDREICARIGPTLRDQGLIFVGIDVIGDVMTEINVTSPTGIQEIERFDGTNIAALIWDAIIQRRG